MPAAWANTNFFGTNAVTVPPALAYSTNVTDLTPGTNYTYRYYAVNAGGSAWGAATNFTTWIDPAVNNGAGAKVVDAVKALLRGNVTQCNPTPQAYFCLDTSDKGTTGTGAWNRVISAGTQSGAFSNLVTGLTPNTLYYYRCYATNAAGYGWAEPYATFTYLGINLGNFRINTSGLNLTLDMVDGKPIAGTASNATTAFLSSSATADTSAGNITVTNVGDVTIGKIDASMIAGGTGIVKGGNVAVGAAGNAAGTVQGSLDVNALYS